MLVTNPSQRHRKLEIHLCENCWIKLRSLMTQNHVYRQAMWWSLMEMTSTIWAMTSIAFKKLRIKIESLGSLWCARRSFSTSTSFSISVSSSELSQVRAFYQNFFLRSSHYHIDFASFNYRSLCIHSRAQGDESWQNVAELYDIASRLPGSNNFTRLDRLRILYIFDHNYRSDCLLGIFTLESHYVCWQLVDLPIFWISYRKLNAIQVLLRLCLFNSFSSSCAYCRNWTVLRILHLHFLDLLLLWQCINVHNFNSCSNDRSQCNSSLKNVEPFWKFSIQARVEEVGSIFSKHFLN